MARRLLGRLVASHAEFEPGRFGLRREPSSGGRGRISAMGCESEQAGGVPEVRRASLAVRRRDVGPVPRRRERDDRQPSLRHLSTGHDHGDRDFSPGLSRPLESVRSSTERPSDPGDAAKPEMYGNRTSPASVLYQDIAQRDQAAIFRRNLGWLRPGGTGFLMIKARSEDVAANPVEVYEAAKRDLMAAGVRILDRRVLAPYQTDHAVLVVKKP